MQEKSIIDRIDDSYDDLCTLCGCDIIKEKNLFK